VEVLRNAGCLVVGPVADVCSALSEIGRTPIDVAVLDVSLLDGEQVFPVMEVLTATNIPFVVVTGYSPDVVPLRFRGCPIISKPYFPEELVEKLAFVLPEPPSLPNAA